MVGYWKQMRLEETGRTKAPAVVTSPWAGVKLSHKSCGRRWAELQYWYSPVLIFAELLSASTWGWLTRDTTYPPEMCWFNSSLNNDAAAIVLATQG